MYVPFFLTFVYLFIKQYFFVAKNNCVHYFNTACFHLVTFCSMSIDWIEVDIVTIHISMGIKIIVNS